jgi:hypothetical protein
MAEFLEREPLEDEQISTLSSYLHIKNFHNNSSVNYEMLGKIGLYNDGEEAFIRKGMENKIR